LPITPLIHGGEQDPYRSGTYAVHDIVGFGEAAKIANERLNENIAQLEALEKKVVDALNEKFKSNIVIHSDHLNKVPGIINVQFKGINNQILLKRLAPIIAASSGS